MKTFDELQRIQAHAKRIQNLRRFGAKSTDRATAALYADEERREEKKQAARVQYIHEIPDERLRLAFIMHFIEGKEWEEIADDFGDPRGKIFKDCYSYSYRHALNLNI